MKVKHKLILGVLISLFIVHQISQKALHLKFPFIDNYADPFLGISILLFAFKSERKFLCKRKKLTTLEIFLVMLSISIISEVLFPYLSTDFTSDPFDFLSFSAGAIFYFKVLND